MLRLYQYLFSLIDTDATANLQSEFQSISTAETTESELVTHIVQIHEGRYIILQHRNLDITSEMVNERNTQEILAAGRAFLRESNQLHSSSPTF